MPLRYLAKMPLIRIFHILMLCGTLGMGLAAGATTVNAEVLGVPEDRVTAFTVLRDGDEIGTHVLTFESDTSGLKVSVATDIEVTLPLIPIPVYRFTHRGEELWREGRLVKLDSTTDDDGTDHRLSVAATADSLHVVSDKGAHASPSDIIPASLWNPELRRQIVLLNTLDGTEMEVSIQSLGEEMISARGVTQRADHVKLTGGLERDLWYTKQGVLVRVRFAAKDDSIIEYVLR